MSLPFSFKAQRRSSSPEFSEAASFLAKPFGGAAEPPVSKVWGVNAVESEDKENGVLPAERLFRPESGEAKPISPRPRVTAVGGAGGAPSSSPASAPQTSLPDFSTPSSIAPQIQRKPAASLAFAESGRSPAPSVEPTPSTPLAMPQEVPTASQSPFSKPTAQPQAPPSGAPVSHGAPLPATAGEGWRVAELATANREIARLKVREADLLRRVETLETSLAQIRSNPPAPDHRKVIGMLEEWMETHLDGVVEGAVRSLFGQSHDDAEDSSEPWFRRKPLVSMTTPESTVPETSPTTTTTP